MEGSRGHGGHTASQSCCVTSPSCIVTVWGHGVMEGSWRGHGGVTGSQRGHGVTGSWDYRGSRGHDHAVSPPPPSPSPSGSMGSRRGHGVMEGSQGHGGVTGSQDHGGHRGTWGHDRAVTSPSLTVTVWGHGVTEGSWGHRVMGSWVGHRGVTIPLCHLPVPHCHCLGSHRGHGGVTGGSRGSHDPTVSPPHGDVPKCPL